VAFASCVTAGLALLAGLLVFEVRHGRVRRFDAALHYYLAALVAGVGGTILGAAMIGGHGDLRDAHVIVNLLGLIGLVVAGTLPYFAATQVRMKMSHRATASRLRVNLAGLASSVAVAAVGAAADRGAVAAVGLFAYAAALLHLCTMLPRPGEKQMTWAGPRLVQLVCGVLWWAGTVVVAAGRALDGSDPFPEALAVTLVVGGYVQILVASLAYFGPVLRGGGHVRLSAGFATTRSWIALAAGNVAALACATRHPTVAAVALLVLAADVAARASVLVRGVRRPTVT
jgi:nitrite reductase (NO-forming)